MRDSCCDGSFDHCRLEAEEGIADYGYQMAESYSVEGVCKCLDSCLGVADLTPSNDLGPRNDPVTILTPFSEAQAWFSAFWGVAARTAMVLKDDFWRMNSWRRGWPEAPLAPMMRTEIDMRRKT
jgi:hypothetical protein